MYINCDDITARCKVEHAQLSVLCGGSFPFLISAWVQLIEDVANAHRCKAGQAALGLVADLHSQDHVDGPAASWILAALWEHGLQIQQGDAILKEAQGGAA